MNALFEILCLMLYLIKFTNPCLKSYRTFHEDLFPDTYAPEPSLTVAEWQEGKKAQVCFISTYFFTDYFNIRLKFLLIYFK